MSNVFGTLYRVTIFGESHSAAIGVVIDGIPAGMPVDLNCVRAALKRRAPSASAASTKRRESDEPEILSGCVDGRATGTPLAAIIRNRDARSQDYEQMKYLLRPGHADYTGGVKYGSANDIRGGGHFSGRLTAPLVFAGNIATQYLNTKGIHIGAHIGSIADVVDGDLTVYTPEAFAQLEQKPLPVLDDAAAGQMRVAIERARAEQDSVGGVIEAAIAGLPAGLGELFFDSVESELAHMMFSIPAVKGVAFGAGFGMAAMRGSEANDAPSVKDGGIAFLSNHNGGINGGITNGMPVVFRVAVKPTPSIGRAQKTVDIQAMKEETLEIEGRHDACIVPRAVEVVKCAAAVVMMDLYLRRMRNE